MSVKSAALEVLARAQGRELSRESALELLSRITEAGYEDDAGPEVEPAELRVLAGRIDESSAPSAARRLEEADSATQELTSRLASDLAACGGEVLELGAGALKRGRPLHEQGFNSLSLVGFSHMIEQRFGIRLSPADLFEHTTIDSLARHLVECNAAVLGERYGGGGTTLPQPERAVPPQASGTYARAAHAHASVAVAPERAPRVRDDEVAIVGMSGSMPGSEDLDSFWRHLHGNDVLVGEVPPERWDWRARSWDEEMRCEHPGMRWGAFVRDVDKFDHAFFGIAPREAELMDPQHRLFLQHTWAALEDAGIDPDKLAGTRTGLYVGTGAIDYLQLVNEAQSAMHPLAVTGNAESFIASRVSQLLDLRGPSEPVNTACSASLVALHRAAACIRGGDCDIAIAGGVHLILTPTGALVFSRSGMLSPEGRCKTFDSSADGYVRGEGVGVVVLMSLARARELGHSVYAVLRSSSVNHGGRAESLTAPNPRAQRDLLIDAYTRAAVDPGTVGYIEAHGTGTKLGDPIELNGLRTAFRELYAKAGRPAPAAPHIAVGSVKTNIGHLETAAGIAGVLKVLLMLKHKVIPGNPGLREPSPYLDLSNTPFYLAKDSEPWAAMRDGEGGTLPRRAGVSSFGFSGCNAHVVLEEYCEEVAEAGATVPGAVIVPVSARSADGLERRLRQLQKFLLDSTTAEPDATAANGSRYGVALRDLSYTLQVGRKQMDHRAVFVVRTLDDLAGRVQDALEGRRQFPTGEYAGKELALRDFLHGDVDVRRALDDTVRKWALDGELHRVAQLWVSGIFVDWESLYGGARPRRVSLPTYPFARERCWVSAQKVPPAAKNASVLHPLAHANVSDLAEQRYRCDFTGEEFFLRDHRVYGHPVLSSSALIEMGRAAGELATHQPVFEVADVRWPQAVIGDERGACTTTALSYVDDDLCFVVRGLDGLLACSGVLRTADAPSSVAPARIELADFRSRCPHELRKDECYATFERQEVRLGSGLRGIEQFVYGDALALARLAVPDAAAADWERYGLHPSIMDGVIQSVILLDTASREESSRVALPTGIGAIRLHRPLPRVVHACIRRTSARSPDSPETEVVDYDVSLVDETGGLCVAVEGFGLKVLRKHAAAAVTPANQQRRAAPSGGDSRLLEPVRAAIVAQVSGVLKLDVASTHVDTELTELGLESVVLMELSARLSGALGVQIAPTLLYEYRTVESLAEHLIANHTPVLSRKFDRAGDEAAGVRAEPRTETVRDEAALRAVRGRRSLPSPGFDSDPIVIVGMAGRFPGSPNLDAYWANLRSNADLICDVPPERWRWQDYYGDPQAEPGKTRARWGGFIEEVDKFDCRFFGISPREAELMDPQQRLFVETVWAAIEDSGTDPSTLSGAAVGVFVGGGSSDYLELLRESEGGLRPHMVTGNVTTFLANRVSYLLNLRGPSQPIETACSASLIAVHRAVQAIRAGECDMALAGGVNLILTPTVTLAFSTMGVISPQGRCRVFDRGADGYVRGEGVGAVFLMRQSRALRDGNPIHAVIKGSGENHGGHANSLTAPSPAGLKELLVRTYKAADVDPRTVNYVEAHGTGTVLGDPIEIAALTESFAQLGVASGGAPDIEGRSCAIGSVKANIGHLETAAGIASVIKVALMLRHRAVPANGLLREQNEYIDLTGTPFRLPTETCEWLPLRDARGVALPRRAGISSFGAGGSNAHLILEEASGARSEGTERASPAPSVVLPISARTPERLREYVHRVSQFVTNALERPGSLNIADLAYTFQAGRNAMRFRAAFVAADLDTLADKMRAFLARQGHGGEAAPGSPGDVLSVDQDWRAGAGFELADMVERWLGGERVDWRALHSGETRARISAPTYPFERVHCWAAAPKRPSLSGSGNLAAQPEPVADERRREAVLQLLHEATKHPLDEISESQRLTDLGIDSIMALALKADVERLFDTVLSATDLGVMTVRELVALVGDADSAVARNVEGRPALPLQGDLVTRQLRKYPELQVLQKHGERPATFWFYSGFGTVQPYISLAEALTGVLPFLAFQASGITGAKKPFRTINDIAKYHAEVIRELQPSGDFQLGGYSFGGVLAYECARELQLAGGNVRSIVLLDSFYPGVPFPEISNRTALLLTFMVFLKTQGLPIGDLAAEHVRDDELERYLVELGVRRGLKYTHDEFLAIFRKFLHLVDDRMLSDYRPLSLPRPQDVHALYFRRSDPGRFFAASMGEAGPRGAVDEVASNLPADEIGRVNREFAVNDAGAWRSVLPVIEMHVTAAPDHFSLLDDPRSFELIANKLRELYGTASI